MSIHLSLPKITLPKMAAAAALFTPVLAMADGTADWLQPVENLNAGDSAWMMISAALVLFMTLPGLALFYGGMARKKNVLSMMVQSFAVAALVSVLWMAVGYSIAFTPNNGFLGGFDRVFLSGMTFMAEDGKLTIYPGLKTIPESVFFFFQMTFAIISSAIITGAFAERMKFSAIMVFIALWVLIVYAPTAHWVWGSDGWLAKDGVLDYAGGTVVHINAGIAGLVGCVLVGKRLGYGKEAMAPHNLTLTLIGVGMLWVGWFGFNAGSAGAADGRAGMAMVTTQVATAGGALAWMLSEKVFGHKASALGLASGALSGLVGITPAAGFVAPVPALVIGILTAVVCYFSVTKLKIMLKYDDSMDAFGIHGIGGMVGAVLTGVFVSTTISGASVNWLAQIEGIVITVLYSGIVSLVLLKIIDKTMGLRVDADEERQGLDISSHGERIE